MTTDSFTVRSVSGPARESCAPVGNALGMADPFEEAWRLEKERQERVKAELSELGKANEEGKRAGRAMQIAGLVLVALVFAGLSVLMLLDPGARKAWFVLMLTLAMMGLWRFFKRS